jgi:hypothetical protein
MRRIRADFAFDAEATEVGTPLAQAFAGRRGVCQVRAAAGPGAAGCAGSR